MVLVCARQPDILATVTEALFEQGVVAKVVAHGGDDDLVDRAWADRPEYLIAISSLPALSDPTPGSDDALLEEALSAARAPARPILVWVTASDADGEARRIRKSGIPYVILRVGRLARPSNMRPEPRPGLELDVPDDLFIPNAGLSSLASVADAVVMAIGNDDCVGNAIDVAFRGEDAWLRVVESHGASGRLVSRGRARWSSLWGGRVLSVPREVDGTSPTDRWAAIPAWAFASGGAGFNRTGGSDGELSRSS